MGQSEIYFPSDEERDAIAVHAVRTSGGASAGSSGSSGGGYAQNPDYKYFSNVNGAELLMTPTGISAAAETAGTTSVILDTEGNATIKGNEIEITADQDLSIGTPTGEGGTAVLNLYLEGSKITAQIGEGAVTKIEITEETHIISTFVKLNTGDAAPVDPSAATIMAEVTAGDAAVGTVVLAVGVTVVGAIVTGATAGLGTALVAPAMAWTYGLAATTVAVAAADISEGKESKRAGRPIPASPITFFGTRCFLGIRPHTI
ncbi:hypothetical protein [Enterocloster clostridioformis]|uniref:hypothetical protein n=1 Tax=Enterocloster clostridioformis TaxID=1531 RepID=UPI0004073252|nr:hypothetical protein [Enterocloster clostridioformis]